MEETEENEALMEAFADSADEVLNLLRRMNGTEESVPSPQKHEQRKSAAGSSRS